MFLSTINFNRCGRWQKNRLIFNTIGCSKFGTISAGTRPNSSNMLTLKCSGCIHPIPSSHLQMRQFNIIATISSMIKSLTKAPAATGNEQQPKPSESIETNENQQTESSPETTEEEQQQKQQQNETLIGQLQVESPPANPGGPAQSRPKDLTRKKSISIGTIKTLNIQCQQWENGQKFLNIYTRLRIFQNLPNILVPQGAYKFVAAMDEVIRQLPVKEPKHPEGDESPMILTTQIIAGGRHYDFKLSALHKKGRKWQFKIWSVPTSEKHREEEAHFPLWALPWLRKQMVEMLAEHDGTEQIDEMPTMPEWATEVSYSIS